MLSMEEEEGRASQDIGVTNTTKFICVFSILLSLSIFIALS